MAAPGFTMSEVLIHIGYHKTATTWLQNMLFTAENAWFIPLSTKTHGPSTLAGHFIYDRSGYLLNSFDDNVEVIREELALIDQQHNAATNTRIPVMSEERLSGNPHSSGFDAAIIARRIHRIFPSGKILIMLREQSAWILSNFFQYLAIGGTHSLYKYLNTKYDGKRPGFAPGHLCFHYLIKQYQDLFDPRNVLVLPYELFETNSTLFFEKLSAFVGKEIKTSPSDHHKKLNRSGNHYLNYKLRNLNLFLHSSSVNNHSALKNSISRNLSNLARTALRPLIPPNFNTSLQTRMKQEIEQWSEGRFTASNRITRDLIQIDLAEYGYAIADA